MPIVFLVIFYNFAAALSLYYVINNCVSIVQIYRNLRKPLPEAARKSMELWTGCVAGALVDVDYEAKLKAVGFADVGIEPTRVYTRDDVAEMAASSSGPETEAALRSLEGAVMSAFVRARKP